MNNVEIIKIENMSKSPVHFVIGDRMLFNLKTRTGYCRFSDIEELLPLSDYTIEKTNIDGEELLLEKFIENYINDYFFIKFKDDSKWKGFPDNSGTSCLTYLVKGNIEQFYNNNFKIT